MPEAIRRVRGHSVGVRVRKLKGAGSDEKRDNSYRRGYATKRWREYRAGFLRENPWCVRCLYKFSIEVPAFAVDHIRAVSGPDDPDFWTPSNHQGLCKRCHSWKTATCDGGFGNRKRTPEFD